MHALLFAGQGIQRRGMGAELLDRYPETVERASAILGRPLAELCLRDPERLLRDTRFAQPAVFVVNALAGLAQMAHGRAEGAEEPGFTLFAGHSLGEYNALVAAGVLTFDDALRLVVRRAALMSEIPDGAMAAVIGAPVALVERALREGGFSSVSIANLNSDRQTAIAGERTELKAASIELAALPQTRVVALNVSGPFHTPLMEPAAERFGVALADAPLHPARATVVSSVTGEPMPDDADGIRALLRRQISAPVQWTKTIRGLRAAGADGFTEAYGKTLTSLLAEIR